MRTGIRLNWRKVSRGLIDEIVCWVVNQAIHHMRDQTAGTAIANGYDQFVCRDCFKKGIAEIRCMIGRNQYVRRAQFRHRRVARQQFGKCDRSFNSQLLRHPHQGRRLIADHYDVELSLPTGQPLELCGN